MKVPLLAALALAAAAHPALALDAPTVDYMRSLQKPDRTVLVMEYIDPRLRAATERVGLSSKERFHPTSGDTFRISDELSIQLDGITACPSDVPIQYDDYQGTCAGLAAEGLDIQLRRASVVICRAFEEQKDLPVQRATCYTYIHIPDALEAVDMVEEMLVEGGWVFATRNEDGTYVRPELAAAEQRAVTYGLALWSMKPVPTPWPETLIQ